MYSKLVKNPTFVSICLFSGLLSGLLGGCSFKSTTQPAVLVIMVDSLGFGSFSCGDNSGPTENQIFGPFCSEAVRFTHAYTPSPMSQPTVASILTGLYPREHGVRHNGPQALEAKIETIAELARAKGYKSSFFSGGPPVWRRAAFNQGFDVFDDSVQVSQKSPFRPVGKIIDLFLSWQASEAPRGNFLSLLYIPDPQFIDQPTTDQLGEVRENSYQSQVEAVSESLDRLVREMKSRKVWDTTTVMLVGLNGAVRSTRVSEPLALNLFSESTRSILMIKPARKKSESPFNWKIDSNVSLVDVGTTLFALLDPETAPPASRFSTVSLESALSGPQPSWSEDRKIITESAWAQWRGAGGIRAALRRGPFLYVFDENDQMFNTLSDYLELSPLPLAEARYAALRDEFGKTLRSFDFVPWKTTDRALIETTLLGQELWRERTANADTLRHLSELSKQFRGNRQLLAWRAWIALQRADWPALEAAAGKDHPAWTYVAAVNQGKKADPPADGCWRSWFQKRGQTTSKDCGDEMARSLMIATDGRLDAATRERAMDIFSRGFAAKQLAERIGVFNAVAGDQWDVVRTRYDEPTMTDLLLALPDLRKFRKSLSTR